MKFKASNGKSIFSHGTKCPHAKRPMHMSVDWCELFDKLCLLETPTPECDEWKDIQREWRQQQCQIPS